jgi:hypothetical protein
MSTKKEWAEEYLDSCILVGGRRSDLGIFEGPKKQAYLAGFDRAIEEVLKNQTDLCDYRGHIIEAVLVANIKTLGGEDEHK